VYYLLIEVTDTDSNPLENVQIKIDGEGSKETNSEGTVEFSGLKEQKYKVEISKTGYETKTENVSANSKDQITTFKLKAGATLIDTNEYIDIDNTTMKLLFKTDIGNQVNLYLGTNKDNLTKEATVDNFSNGGMTVDNLEGGTKYYYQIEAVNGDATVTSEVLSFTKLSRTNDWQEFNTAVKDINPDAFLVGENWTDTATMAKYFEDLDSSFNFPLANKLLNMAYGNDVDILGDVKDIHNQYATYSNQFIDSTFLSNHDQPRVTFLLGDHEKSKLAASVLFTMPGTPFVYYGEEIGQVGHNLDGEFITANDSISVEEQSGEQESIFEHYKKLISIRKNNPAEVPAGTYVVDKMKVVEATTHHTYWGNGFDWEDTVGPNSTTSQNFYFY
jgi:hypothetical protein